MVAKLIIDPPLLNSSSPWASNLADLRALYACPFTGAVTTRTSLLRGFNDNPNQHQHCFFDAGTAVKANGATSVGVSTESPLQNYGNSSLNTYGYSPIPLHEYLAFIRQIVSENGDRNATIKSAPAADSALTSSHTNGVTLPTSPPAKLIIISVTGTPDEITSSYEMIHELSQDHVALRLAMEINLSCPNIAGKPPPAYDAASLTEYLHAVRDIKQAIPSNTSTATNNKNDNNRPNIAIGIKLPPYTYQGQFDTAVDCLRQVTRSIVPVPSDETSAESVIDFITSTNTLGSSLMLDNTAAPALQSESGTGIGGMAGAAIHGLSLGNVATLRGLLDRHAETKRVFLIGVGGVSDWAGFERMRSVGASAVGVATALGRDGIQVFGRIATAPAPVTDVGS